MIRNRINIKFSDRHTYNIVYQLDETLGPKTLPYSLGAAINNAAYLIDKYNDELLEEDDSCAVVPISIHKCCNYCLYINNSTIEDNKSYNILYNNINNNFNISVKGDELCTKDKIKTRAKGMFDVHLGAHPTKVLPQTSAGWKWILMTYAKSSILNFHYVQDLIQSPYKYELETCDIVRTLKKVMRTMGETNYEMIKEAINIALESLGDIDKLSKYLASIRYKFNNIINEFFDLTGQDGIDYWKSKFLIRDDDYVDYSDDETEHTKFKLNIYEYGAKRNQKWKSVVDRSGHFCLFVTRRARMAMASYKNKYGWKALRKLLEIQCGFTYWFDFNVVSRPMQLALAKYKDVQIPHDEEILYDYASIVCDLFSERIFKKDSNQQETHVEGQVNKDNKDMLETSDKHEDNKELPENERTSIRIEDLPKTSDGSTDWSKVESDKEQMDDSFDSLFKL